MKEQINEDLFFPLSAINHYSFCPRRCALVHMECVWSENYFTAIGKKLHENVDAGGVESRGENRFARNVHILSRELGVVGIADVIEFHRDNLAGASIQGWKGLWMPYPVEFKWGTAENDIPYKRQLCAQVICLEEMFHIRISEGALFLGAEKHRHPVKIDNILRNDTKQVCKEIRDMLKSGVTPQIRESHHCKSCSLVDDCMPNLSHLSAKSWLERQFEENDI